MLTLLRDHLPTSLTGFDVSPPRALQSRMYACSKSSLAELH